MYDLLEAIEQRCSRRRYLPTQLDTPAIAMLNSLIEDINSREKLKMYLLPDSGDAFNGLRKSYGLFSGVRHAIVQVGNREDLLTREKMGYFGEFIILHATAIGLGTCWVGGTYDESSFPLALNENEEIICNIVVGNVGPDLSVKEKLVRWGGHRKSKALEQLYTSDGSIPDWFLAGMKAVQKAPSAVNRQPVMFAYQNNTVTASVQDISDKWSALDLGIAKLHFELGAGGGLWNFGNHGIFIRESQKYAPHQT